MMTNTATEQSNKSVHGKTLNSKTEFYVGMSSESEILTTKLSELSSLLVFGNSGTGKTSFVYALLSCLIKNNNPSELRIIIYDSKQVDYMPLNGMPYLMLPVISSFEKYGSLVGYIESEIDERLQKLSKYGTRNIDDYNSMCQSAEKLERIVVVFDSFNDIAASNSKSSGSISSIINKCGIVGINIIFVASALSKELKSVLPSIPARVVFTCSKTDSQAVLGKYGAESLNCPGESIFKSVGTSINCQSVYTEYNDFKLFIDSVNSCTKKSISYLGSLAVGVFDPSKTAINAKDDNQDELLSDVIMFAQQCDECTPSMLQRRYRIGYNRAMALMDELKSMGLVNIQEKHVSQHYEKPIEDKKSNLNKKYTPIGTNHNDNNIHLRSFPSTTIEGTTISIYGDEVHINQKITIAGRSGHMSASFGGGEILSISYKAATGFSRGYLYFELNQNAPIKENYSGLPFGFNQKSVPIEKYTTISFKKNSNATMKLLATQVAEDISQIVRME